MGHNLEALGSATLDTMGGLITNANPQDLPEGASPRCYDVDFIVGSVFTRAGLQTVYSFAGEFVGPNICNLATDIPTGNSSWVNITGIEGTTSYASVNLGALSEGQKIPGTVTQVGTAWTNPQNLTRPGFGPNAATTTITATRGNVVNTTTLTATNPNFSLPAGAEAVGVVVSVGVSGIGTNKSGGFSPTVLETCSLVMQLVSGGTTIGSPIVLLPTNRISNVGIPFTLGSSSNTWGVTGLDAATVNNPSFGVNLYCSLHVVEAATFTNHISANSLTLTVYYTGAESDELWAQSFTFAIPSTAGITGIGASFNAFANAPTSVTLQLLKNGVAVGTPKTQVLTTTPTNYTLGTATDLWGSTWLYSDLNNTKFGVQITAVGDGTTNIQNVQTTAYITASLVNFNYIKTYEQNSGLTYTMALDANGIIWREDVTNNPDVLSPVLTGIIPGSFAKSATFDNREHILFSNLAIGTDRPRVYNGTDFDPLSQIGPGAPPNFVSSIGTGTGVLNITSYSLTSNIVTFIISTAATAPVV